MGSALLFKAGRAISVATVAADRPPVSFHALQDRGVAMQTKFRGMSPTLTVAVVGSLTATASAQFGGFSAPEVRPSGGQDASFFLDFADINGDGFNDLVTV